MTAYGSDDTINQAQKQGALCCMAKPFDVESLKKFLEEFTLLEIENSRCRTKIV